MAGKVAELKQTFCFKSLRLLEKRNSSTRSFSDSEITVNENFRKLNIESREKSKSHCLLTTNLNAENIQKKRKRKWLNFSETNLLKERGSNTNQSSLMNSSMTSKDSSGDYKNANDLDQMEASFSIQDSILEEMINKNISETNQEKSSEVIKRSGEALSPYRILEDGTSNENLLGEPRCLTLKKYSGDINPFLADDCLILEPDFEEADAIFQVCVTPTKSQDRHKSEKISDIFLDDEEIKPTKKKSATADKEEGELSPEIRPTSKEIEKPAEGNSDSKLDVELFRKVNECLRDLEKKCKDIYVSSTSEHYKKFLQITLSNVDSIKRKLSFLVNSRKIEHEKKKRIRKNSGRSSKFRGVSSSHIHSRSERDAHSIRTDDRHDTKSSKDYSRGNERERHLESNEDHRRKTTRIRPSQADLLNRKKISILEKIGTKEEIQRIQSLFKRQMNLITQHVIQKKETGRSHNTHSRRFESSRKRRSPHTKDEKNSHKIQHNVDLNNLKTLEDMEFFLETLKSRTSDKTLSEQYLAEEKKKKSLMFTSKKERIKSALEDKTEKSIPKMTTDISKISKEKIFQKIPDKDESIIKNQDKRLDIDNERDKHEKGIESNFNPKEYPLSENNPTKKDGHSKISIKNIFAEPTTNKMEDRTLDKENTLEKHKMKTTKTSNHNKTHEEKCISEANYSLEKNKSVSTEIIENSQCFKPSDLDQVSELNKEKNGKRKREHSGKRNNVSELGKEEHVLKKRKVGDSSNEKGKGEIAMSKDDAKFPPDNEMRVEGNLLIRDFLSKKIIILDDNNCVLDSPFRLKVIGNEVYLKKTGSKRKHKHKRASVLRQIKSNQPEQPEQPENHLNVKDNSEQTAIDPEIVDRNLEEMESFLQELRSKKKVSDNEQEAVTSSHSQEKEVKFLARIQAKRKAKLMACLSNSTEKEAKFLKALEKREEELSESSDVENRKQKLIKKIRAERDAIVSGEKQGTKMLASNSEDPLLDVKTFLNMIKEAEASNDESSKQDYVSFSLKRSDVKKLENLTTGKASSMSEESQKFLNSVRAKMKAKKVPVSNISHLMKKPDE